MANQKVETEAVLKGKVRKEFAWKIISDYSRYEFFMENVDKINILERTPTEGKSEWFVTIEEAPLKWVERDYYDVDNYELRFESIGGDFESIRGRWKVENFQNEGIKIFFTIEYDLGIPVIEEVLGHILKEKMKTNIDSMIHAIKEELTKSQDDDRKYPRYNIGKYNNISLNNKLVRAFIVNVSKKGMMFYYDGEFDAQNILVKIQDIALEAEALFNDLKHKNIRIIFKQIITQTQLESLVGFLGSDSIRAYERENIDKYMPIIFSDSAYSAFVINISPKGILFRYDGTFDWRDEMFELAGVKLLAREVHHEIASKTIRIAFTDTLNDIFYADLLKKINHYDVGQQQMELGF